MPSPQKFCGVDAKLLEEFLILIRDKYKGADMATFFLEKHTGISNIYGITNLRDVLSHLATFLDPSTPEDKRRDQRGNAEEHLRRTTIEPYETALAEFTIKFDAVYLEYQRKVLPNKDRITSLIGAPNRGMVDARFREIGQFREKGRAAKARNIWDQEWEHGITALVEAFDNLEKLISELSDYCARYDQAKQGSKAYHLNVWSLAIGVLGVGLTVFFFILYPEAPRAVRRLLNIEHVQPAIPIPRPLPDAIPKRP